MNKTLRKINLILLIAILLPSIFFAVYEISNLSESEEVIERIYKNQLDAILFSVNQYSEDVVSQWRNKIINGLSNPSGKLMPFFNLYSPIDLVFTVDSLNTISLYSKSGINDSMKAITNSILDSNKNPIDKLRAYKKEGYLKLEPVKLSPVSSCVIFLLDDNTLCGIIFNSSLFVREMLSPKIRGISGEEFIITVFNNNSKSQIFSTEEIRLEDMQQQASLWLLPAYDLGIMLKGQTIDELVKERSYTNLILILVLIVFLIGGVIFVLRNIKKEIELTQIKSDFVSNVSHELRTPLALISMFSETLEMGRVRTEEKKKEYYSIIKQETGRLSRIVNKILSFSQIEAGKRKYSFDQTNINSIIKNILNTYSFHLDNNGFKYSFKEDESIPEITADKEALTEAVINLIDNAVKYSKDNREIVIKTGSENNSVFIEVSDRGVGISYEDQKRIFDKFFRVSSGHVHNTKGTGLGLTLVKHIVDAHNGEIRLTSSPGKGSSFKLIFKVNKNFT
jgi:two-component system phosphate regulon sensor histidine kinase PhoR